MKYFIVLLCFSLTILSCGSDDGNASSTNYDAYVEGKWDLNHVNGGINGINQNIDSGKLEITFNPNTHKVNVVNNLTIQDEVAFYFTGEYNYSVSTNYQNITISSGNYIIVAISSTALILKDIATADGYTYAFTKL